jgi:hypothetical protein
MLFRPTWISTDSTFGKHGRQSRCELEDLGIFGWALAELIEASVRSDMRDVATDALSQLDGRARACGTDWALGVRARSAALLSEGTAAEALLREAIDRLIRTRIVVHVARALLVYGEWLRRGNQRVDAREHLRAAHDTFSRIGAEAFADRARRELLATGKPRASASTRGATSSRLKRHRSPGWPATASPTPTSAHSCSSVPEPFSTTPTRSFQGLDISSRNQLGRIPSSRLEHV